MESKESNSSILPDNMTEIKSNEKRMLLVCHSFNSFQKDSIEESSKYFKEIKVLVRTNPMVEISNYLPISRLERFKESSKIDLTNKPRNIDVIPTPIWYLPTDRSYKSLGAKHWNIVRKAIQRNHSAFDIVHAHFLWSAGYVGARIKMEYDVPFVVTAHGYDIYHLPFKDDEWRKRIEFVLNTSDRIITVSKSNLACIKRLDVSTPVTVIPNGFRSNLFYPQNKIECRKALKLPLEKQIILTVGNLEPIKGQKYLIDAIKIINSEKDDVLCIIIGVGSLRHSLERQIHTLGLDDDIMLVGGMPHDDIPLWMNACDLFVLPSLNEGNPTVMFEALGCGKPFLGTKVGGIPEIIISDNYGHLVEPADSNDMAQKILASLNQTWDSKKIRTYAERYDWDNASREIVRVYEQILN